MFAYAGQEKSFSQETTLTSCVLWTPFENWIIGYSARRLDDETAADRSAAAYTQYLAAESGIEVGGPLLVTVTQRAGLGVSVGNSGRNGFGFEILPEI